MISTDGVLHSFNPATLQFETIGTLDCNTFASPNSMAVSRDAVAYVNMSDGTLWKVSTANAHCQATNYQLGQLNRRIRGMGFSSDTAQRHRRDALHVHGERLDVHGRRPREDRAAVLPLTLVGDYTSGLARRRVRAHRHGRRRSSSASSRRSRRRSSREIDKTSGATPSPITLTGVNTTLSYAFSFWGGDFWFYTQGNGAGSTVTHYKYATDKSYVDADRRHGLRHRRRRRLDVRAAHAPN